ncbi:hypothetical protein DXG01_015998 [Tephrocybe rancida]|nr:hypothetical protein DXG01_015998 [Tephrocybe rancida]
MFNLHPRAPWAGAFGITCAALALWYYTSRSTKEKRTTKSANVGRASHTNQIRPPAASRPLVTGDTTSTSVQGPLAIAEATPTAVAAPPPGPPGPEVVPTVPFTIAPPQSPLTAASPPVAEIPPIPAPPYLLPVPPQAAPGVPALRSGPRFEIKEGDPLNITLGIRMDAMDNDTGERQQCAQSLLHIPADFKVAAGIHPRAPIPWCLENLQELSKGISAIKDDDQLLRCKALTVSLPRSGKIYHNTDVEPFVLPAVTTLTWISYRNQFPLLIYPTTIPSRLTHFTLVCDFCMWDCAFIMREFSATLQVLKVKRLIGPANDNSLSIFRTKNSPSTIPSVAVNMVALQVLDIDSDFSPGTMLNGFEFPELTEFHLTTYRSKLLFFDSKSNEFDNIIWNRIKKTTINGDFVPVESRALKAICKGSYHDHDHNYRPST